VARTVNQAARAVRRDAFVEAAQGLIARKGYEGFSIQDLLGQVNASKGAFYHYFDSKQALLSAVIDDMTDSVLAIVEPVLSDPKRPAAEKFTYLFSTIGRWKAERSDLMFQIIEVWLSDANTVVREHLRASVTERLTPILAAIVEQGARDGTVTAPDPPHTAIVFVSMLLASQEAASRLFLAHRAGATTLDEVERTLLAYTSASERVLGVPPGTLPFIDRQTLEFWFVTPTQSERESAA